MSGSTNDLFGELFKLNKIDLIKKFLIKLKEIFQNNFYIEIQRHNENDEKNFEDFMINLSSLYDVPIICITGSILY